jgi:autotransporter-associated beta strand protein
MQSLAGLGGDFRVDVGAQGDLVEVTGSAVFTSSTDFIPVFSSIPVPGSYTLLTAGTLSFNQPPTLAGTNGGRFTMALDRVSQANKLLLNISGANKALTWTGATSSIWDHSASNWTDGVGAEKFFEFDTVAFTDSAVNRTVTLRTIRNVGAVLVNNSAGNDYVFTSGSIVGPAGIHKTGAGTLTLNNSNDFTGPLIIDGGKVIVDSIAALGAVSSRTIVNPGGSLDINGYEPSILKTFTLSGTGVAGEGALVNTRSSGSSPILGRIELAGNASIGGTQTIILGNLERPSEIIGNGHVLTKTGTNAVVIRGKTGGLSTLGGLTISNGAVILEQADNILGNVPVTVNTGGVLQAASDPVFARTQSNPVILNGGRLAAFQSDFKWAGPVTILNGASELYSSTAGYTISGAIADQGNGFTKSGSETVYLTGANNVTGPVNVADGTLVIGTGGTTGAIAASGVTVSAAGTLRYNLLGAATLLSNITLQAPTSTFQQRGPTQESSLTISKTVGGNTTNGLFVVESGTAEVVTGGAVTVSNVRVGAYPTLEPQQGEAFPSGSETGNIGTLNVRAGGQVQSSTFRVGVSVNVASSTFVPESGIVNQTGGTVTITGADTTSGTFDGPLTIGSAAATGSAYNLSGGTLNVPNGSIDIGTAGVSPALNISGGIAMARRLEIDGRSATAPFGGLLALSGGELIVGTGGIQTANDGTGLPLVDISGGKLSASAASTWAPGMNFETTAAVLNTNGFTVTATGALVGPGGFTKTGSGTLLLQHGDNNVRSVLVSAGRLQINGALSGSVTVEGGTLSGSGTSGPVFLNVGGTLEPGNGVGALNTGDVSFAGGTFSLQINGPAAATQYDQLRVTGDIALNSATALTLSLGYNPADNVDSFVIVANDGIEPVTGAGLFSYNNIPLPEGAVFTANNQLFRISYAAGVGGNDVVLAAIPEPGVFAVLLAGLPCVLTFTGFRRRNRNRGRPNIVS